MKDLTFIPGTVFRAKSLDSVYDPVILPGFEEMKQDKLLYAKSFYIQYCNTDPIKQMSGRAYGEHLYVIQNPPSRPLGQEEMDEVYGYPYMRTYHPLMRRTEACLRSRK